MKARKKLGVVSGEKEGGRKYTQSMATTVGPWRWAFFSLWIQSPSCCRRISISGDSCTIGRHFDAKGRNGGQNCFERCHLLLMASLWPLSRSALKADLNFFMFWPPFLPALKGFDRCYYRRSKVLTAVSTGKQRFWVLYLPALKGMGRHAYLLHQNAYRLCRSHRKRKFVAKKVAAEYRIKRMSSATVPYHHLSIDTSFNPPSFSSDTTFTGTRAWKQHRYSKYSITVVYMVWNKFEAFFCQCTQHHRVRKTSTCILVHWR